MTDKELLELAAKAVGVSHDGYSDCDANPKHMGGLMIHDGDPWNPLEDDGDALRLAVKLGLLVDVIIFEEKTEVESPYIEEPHRVDPYAATRRAIVRAAAEIGKPKA